MHKSWILYSTSVLLGCSILFLILWLYQPFEVLQRAIFSPLPSFLTYTKNGQVTTINLWTPSSTPLNIKNSPVISATSALAYDLTTNKIIYTKSPNMQLPMASLTKIMTAIVALEHPLSANRYIVQDKALVGEDSMGLTTGEVLTLSDLLYGLMLHSANDAAEVLAYNYPQGRSAFVSAMNEKAIALGLKNTHFTNPSGLEGDGKQYTTASDLLVISQYAMANFPIFATIAATFDYTIAQTNLHKAFYLENETNLISSYPGVKGIKTGYTPEAGLCLVTYLDYGGHQIIAVILNSENRRGEMKDILDFSLKNLGIVPPRHG